MLTIILFQPEIPQNSGNVVRTASVTGSRLVLVRPLGFSLSSKHLKRAGLDYWEGVEVEVIDDLFSYLERAKEPFTFFSSKASRSFHQEKYAKDHLLIFGSETRGLDPALYERWPDRFVKIPMLEGKRCLNLATAVGIGVYQALLPHL